MKRENLFKIFVLIILCVCIIFPSTYNLIYNIVNSETKEYSDSISGLPASVNQFENSIAYSNDQVYLSLDAKDGPSDLLSYSTRYSNEDNSKTEVDLKERITTYGEIYDYVSVNDGINVSQKYDEEYRLYASNFYGQSCSYDYADNLLSSVSTYDMSFSYEYYFLNSRLGAIYESDELYAQYSYNLFGKMKSECYPTLGKEYVYTNTSVSEYLYDSITGNKILYKFTNLLGTSPYTVTSGVTSIGGNTYDIVSQIAYNSHTIDFIYEYEYQGVPYITKTITDGTQTTYFSYINDLLVCESTTDYKITYIYGTTEKAIGMLYGYHEDSNYLEIPIAFTYDNCGNIILASRLNAEQNGDNYEFENIIINQSQYNSFGQNVVDDNELDVRISYKGLLGFDELGVYYDNGKFYSCKTGLYLNSYATPKNIGIRTLNFKTIDRPYLTLKTLEYSMVKQEVQNTLAQVYGTSCTDESVLFDGEKNLLLNDIYTLPITLDENNLLKEDSAVFQLVCQSDSHYRQYIEDTYSDLDAQSYVQFVSENSFALGKTEILGQFKYNGNLYKFSTASDGIIEYVKYMQGTYNDSTYYSDVNLFNYDTQKYDVHSQNLFVEENIVSNVSLSISIDDVVEMNEYFEDYFEDISSMYDNIDLTGKTIGEVLSEQDFGNSQAYIQNLINNTFTLNVPDYDPNTQYLEIDNFGNYVVKTIPTGENAYNFKSSGKLMNGILHYVCGALIAVSAISLVVSGGCAIVVVLGVIALSSGVLESVCGALLIDDYYCDKLQEESFIDKLFNGETSVINNIANTARIVGSIALIAGSIVNTFACFVAGTQIATINGFVNIDDIKVGDEVLSYNETTGENEYKTVVETYEKSIDRLVEIYYDDEVIITTTDHPFYSGGEWVSAADLNNGDSIMNSQGEQIFVNDVVIRDAPNTNVYNLEVKDNHNYYVGDDGILVHNSCSIKAVNGDTLDNYTQKDLKNFVSQAEKNVKARYAARGESTSGLFKWAKIRSDIWKETYSLIEKSPMKKTLFALFKNAGDMGLGKAPIINGVRVELHHVVSKANDIFRIVPMLRDKHILFHKTYGYKFFESIARGTPWITS